VQKSSLKILVEAGLDNYPKRRTHPCSRGSTATNSLAPSARQERRDVRRARTAPTARANSRRGVKLNGAIDPCLLISSDRHPHLRTDAADWSPIMPPRHRKLWHSSLPLSHSLSRARSRERRTVFYVHALSIPWPWAHARERASLIARLCAPIMHERMWLRARVSWLTRA